MSKRHANAEAPPRQRKRTRNGVSARRAVLDSTDAMDSTRVRRANKERLAVTYKPFVQISTSQDLLPEDPHVELETGPPPVVAHPKRSKRGKRKKRNDNVSLFIFPCNPPNPGLHNRVPVDQNGNLGCPPANDTGRPRLPRRPS